MTATSVRGEIDAAASIVARRVGARTVVDVRGDGVLAPRRSLAGVLLAASTAGPLGGDHHHVGVEVGEGAALRVGSVSSPVVLPGTGRAATVETDVTVGSGADLRWSPEPTVVSAGSRLVGRATIRLGPGSTLVWDECVVLGRSGEPAGAAELRLDVVGPDGPLCRQGWHVGPGAPGWDGPAGFGGRRVIASRLQVDPALRADAARSLVDGRVVGGVWRHDGWSIVTLAADEIGRLDDLIEELA